MGEGRREWAERIADQFGVTGAAAIDAIEEGVQRGLSLATRPSPDEQAVWECPEPDYIGTDAEGLVQNISKLAAPLHWLFQADAFRSTIEPDRWYVSDGKTARLATEIGASGEREAELVALLLRNLPDILTALRAAKPDDEGLRELLRRCRPYVEAAHAGIDTAAERCALRAELDAALSETVK